jgi:hypothetical protein
VRYVFSGGDRVVGVHLCPPAGVYMKGESARGQGDKGKKIGSCSIFSYHNDIIFCDKNHTERSNY